MKRDEVLTTALEAVKDRADNYTPPAKNFAFVADLWSSYLQMNISAHDVALLMALFKIARARANPNHADTWVDIAGYAACGAEVANTWVNTTKYDPCGTEVTDNV